MVANSFGQFRQTDNMLHFPWETGVLADIFDFHRDPLPLAELEQEDSAGAPGDLLVQLQRFQML